MLGVPEFPVAVPVQQVDQHGQYHHYSIKYSNKLLISDSAEAFPFQRDRTVVFTNAKLMERRDVGGGVGGGAQANGSSPSYPLLPTQYLALHLDAAGSALDRVFAKQSIGLGRLDQFVGMQDPTILQQLVVRVKVCVKLDQRALKDSQYCTLTKKHMSVDALAI